MQLYLELGQIPARFEMQKMRLLFLKYILEQSEDSLISKFFYLQVEQPSRGDWASHCQRDLKELKISETFNEIKLMTKNKFSKMLKRRVKENALEYLTEKQRVKGKEIVYSDIEMAEYLLPTNIELSIEEKRKMFAVRNKMVDIPANFPKSKNENKCFCGQEETMDHIYICEILNKENPVIKFEEIYSRNIVNQNEVFRRFEKNLEVRGKNLQSDNHSPCDPSVIRCYING